MEISDRGLLYPIIGLATASVIAASYHLMSGQFPGAISIANLYLVGLGLGLVVARLGKLGAFGGLLGSPWQEARIENLLAREAARARHYGRDLSVVAIKPTDKSRFDVSKSIRATDQLIVCRSGWNLIVLPETDREGARLLLRRICGDRPVLATQATFDASRPRQRMDTELLESLRSIKRGELVSITDAKGPESHALAS